MAKATDLQTSGQCCQATFGRHIVLCCIVVDRRTRAGAEYIDKVIATGGIHRKTTRLGRFLEAASIDAEHAFILPAELDALGNDQSGLV